MINHSFFRRAGLRRLRGVLMLAVCAAAAGTLLLGGGIGNGANIHDLAHAQSISPLAPASVSATFTPPSLVSVSWSAPASSSSLISGYFVYRNGVVVASVSGFSFTDTVPSSGVYSYTVAAHDPNGNPFSQSAPVSVTVTADTVAPTVPTNLAAPSLTSSSIALSWTAATDNVGVAGYYVIRNGNRVTTGSAITGTTYTDTGLAANTGYSYRVVAYDASGNVSNSSNLVTVSTLPATFTITPPYSLSVAAVSTGEIDVSWQASTDLVGTPQYYLFRNGVLAATTTALSYNDTGLAPNTTYWYYAVAVDPSQLSSAESNTAQTSTWPLQVSPASAVTGGSGSGTPSSSPASGNGSNNGNGAGTGATATVPGTPSSMMLTMNLSYGMSSAQVSGLQQLLIGKGYLGAGYATGFFGARTQAALQQFQCAQNIVCSGSPAATGWGAAGPRTRRALLAGI